MGLKKCLSCGVEKTSSGFYKRAASYDGLQPICSSCDNKARVKRDARSPLLAKERSKRYRDTNKERRSAQKKKSYQKHKKNVAISTAKYRIENKSKLALANKLYFMEHRHEYNARNAGRRAAKLLATPSWASNFILKEAYELAKLRGKHTGFEWHVDHIVPLQSKYVCGLHCEANIQVIPGSENRAKNNRYWPDMPEGARNWA